MTIYLAGGITGVENYKARFEAAKRMLLREGEDRPQQHGALLRYAKGRQGAEPCGAAGGMAGQGIYGRVPCDDPRSRPRGVSTRLGAEPRGSLEMQYCRYEGKPVYKIEEEQLEAWMKD